MNVRVICAPPGSEGGGDSASYDNTTVVDETTAGVLLSPALRIQAARFLSTVLGDGSQAHASDSQLPIVQALVEITEGAQVGDELGLI